MPTDGSTRRVLTYVGVSIFVLVDILLIGWAVTSARSVPTSNVVAGPIPIATNTPTSESTLEVTPTSAASSALASVAPTRILSALDAENAWRAQTGSCPATSANPEYTTDGGLAWTATDATSATEVTALQSIIVEDDGIAAMIGLSAVGCRPAFIKTFVFGANFREYPDQIEDTWYFDPAEASTLFTPRGEVQSPCTTITSLAARDSNQAAVLCADQTLFITETTGEAWSEALAVPNAAGLSASAAGYRLATVGSDECAGVQLRTIAVPSMTIATTGCLELDTSPESLMGFVSVSEADGVVWVWAGDTLVTSMDGGSTWN